MVRYTAEELRRMFDYKHNIRNMSVLTHVDHGFARTQMRRKFNPFLSKAKSTDITLYYEMTDEALKRFKCDRNGNEHLINPNDSPGRVDFAEVTAALRIADSPAVVINCFEGVCVQTEAVLREALEERLQPVLTVNKMDSCLLELQFDGEEVPRVIENANVILATYLSKPTLSSSAWLGF